MENITPKAELVSKNVSEMVADLKYSQGMLQANIETAKEIGNIVINYMNKTNMGEYYEIVKGLSEDKIKEMSIKDINDMFPGHKLMPWDAPDVKDISGEYDYTVDEYRQFLTELYKRIMDYHNILTMIEQARGYVHKMADTLQNVRLNQAKNVAKGDGPEAEKARQYIDDVDNINYCRSFVAYIQSQKNAIINANYDYLKKRFDSWTNKNGRFKDIIETISTCDIIDESKRGFLSKAMMSYIKYSPETTNREIIIKRSIMTRLDDFFNGNMDPKYANELKKNLLDVI